MSAQCIGFSLLGEDVPADVFLEAGRALSGLLSALDLAIAGRQNLKWYIADLSPENVNWAMRPTLQDENAIDHSALVISSALSGLSLIDAQATCPHHFSDSVLLKAKEFVSVITGDVKRIALFGNPGKGKTQRIHVTRRIADHVDQLLEIHAAASGEIEGTLETLTIHDGPAFNLYDSISARRVHCLCDRETLNTLTDTAQLGRRIVVQGEVQFDVQGQPTSVEVKSYRVLRNSQELPQAKDIRGLFAKNKIDIKEWAEHIRE